MAKDVAAAGAAGPFGPVCIVIDIFSISFEFDNGRRGTAPSMLIEPTSPRGRRLVACCVPITGLLRLNADRPVYRLRWLFKLGGVLQKPLFFPPEAVVFARLVR